MRRAADIERLVALGVEKLALNTALLDSPGLLQSAARQFGASTLVASLDVRRPRWGKPTIVTNAGRRDANLDPAAFARQVEAEGAGEILLNSVDRDGTMEGYDLDLVRSVSHSVSIPVIACGGAASVPGLLEALAAGASASAAGSLFVFHGRHRAVLINYPDVNALHRP